MNNKEIIELVEELSSIKGFSDTIQDEENKYKCKQDKETCKQNKETCKQNKDCKEKLNRNKGRYKGRCIGISQFRDIANMCKKCECCEEIKLLIQYKTSKGNGWNRRILYKNRCEKIGDIILKYINQIENSINTDEKKNIEDISKFFGYLFWKAKIIKSN